MDGVLSETGEWRAELGMGAIPRNAMLRLRPARHRLKVLGLVVVPLEPPQLRPLATLKIPCKLPAC